MPDTLCAFCMQPLKPRTMKFADKERCFGYNGCECIEYKNAVAGIQADENKKHEERAAKANQDRLNQLFKQSNLGLRFKERTFGTFVVETEWQKKAVTVALEFVNGVMDGSNKGQGILMTGTVGTGKTHIAAAVTNKLLSEFRPVLFRTSVELLDRIKLGWKDNTDTQIITEMCQVPLLVIDDLGKEFSRKNNEGWSWVQEQYFRIINARYENYLPIIITTNVEIKELEEMYGSAIVSRLIESCRGVKCDGEDWRMKRWR